MVRTAGNAPAFSCSRSKRLTFRLRSEELPSALNPISGHLAVGHHLRPCEVSAGRPRSTGGNGSRKMVEHESNALSIPVWKTGVYLSTLMLGNEIGPPSVALSPGGEALLRTRLRRQPVALVSLSAAQSEGWSPVRELHPPGRFCRPLPVLLGQRDLKCRLKHENASGSGCLRPHLFAYQRP